MIYLLLNTFTLKWNFKTAPGTPCLKTEVDFGEFNQTTKVDAVNGTELWVCSRQEQSMICYKILYKTVLGWVAIFLQQHSLNRNRETSHPELGIIITIMYCIV